MCTAPYKNVLNLEVTGQSPATPTLPVVWEVLRHTDESGERLFEDSVCKIELAFINRAFNLADHQNFQKEEVFLPQDFSNRYAWSLFSISTF